MSAAGLPWQDQVYFAVLPPRPSGLPLIKHRVWRSAAQLREMDLSPCLRGALCRGL